MIEIIEFLKYFVFAIFLLSVFTFLYVKTTPYNEFKLILEEGNEAASIALIGAMLGFVLPIASVMIHAVSFLDFAQWALVALIIQILVGAVITRGFKKMEELMANGLKAAGILLGGLHLVVGVINAASMSY